MPIFTKCPKCGSDAILRYIEPDFKKGVFRRIFICKNGHEFTEEVKFNEEREWMREIINLARRDIRLLKKNQR